MANQFQLDKLRRYMQDYYSKRDGSVLAPANQAFTDIELEESLDDAFVEASDGARTSSTASGDDEPLAMMVARVNCILMIAQDEARRIKWSANNEVVDPSSVADNLVATARELRERYENAKKRKIQIQAEAIQNRPTGGRIDFNSTVSPHANRNFDNATTRRNPLRDHGL